MHHNNSTPANVVQLVYMVVVVVAAMMMRLYICRMVGLLIGRQCCLKKKKINYIGVYMRHANG